MQTGAHELSKLIKQRYVPTSLERKRAIMMYLFVGIIIGLETKKISLYEMFHLKQSLGWWILFFMFLVIFLPTFFIDWFIIRAIPITVFILMATVLVIFMRQARNGVYLTGRSDDKLFLPIFSGLGGWMLGMFDVYYDEQVDLDEEDSYQENSSDEETQQTDETAQTEESK